MRILNFQSHHGPEMSDPFLLTPLRNVGMNSDSDKFTSHALIRVNALLSRIANLRLVFTERPRGWRSVQNGSPGGPNPGLLAVAGITVSPGSSGGLTFLKERGSIFELPKSNENLSL
jgi:hypothetical protein